MNITPKLVEKRWGHEIWFANNEKENYCGKELFIKEGCHTSMHFHLKKHEVFYILEGLLKLELIDTKTGDVTRIVLNEGKKYEIGQGEPHQLIAYKGSVRLIEASTFHEDSDSYRVYDEIRIPTPRAKQAGVHQENLTSIIKKHYINQSCTDGIFMESGAFDGKEQSLSLFLEKEYEFNGVLIEPNTEYENLVKNRPKCTNLNICLSNEFGIKEFMNMGMRSSFKDTEFSDQTKRYINHRNQLSEIKSKRRRTRKASSVLSDLNIKYLDAWFLDVEGHELQALQGYNFKKHPLYLLVIEVIRRKEFPEEHKKIQKLLKEKGFVLKKHKGVTEDEIWVNENYFRKDKLYKK